MNWILWPSVADPERFDAVLDPDPTFQADVDRDPKLLTREIIVFQIFIFSSP